MSDPIPRDAASEGTGAEPGDAGKHASPPLPPEGFPEELLQRRLARLDTRKILAELCKSIPGLDEALLPRGIQADALTRKSGGAAGILKGVARRVMNDVAAWGAFRTAVGDQIPPETEEALEGLTVENVGELAEAHTTEGLLLAAVSGEKEPAEGVVQALVARWREENQQAEKQASESARISELEAELVRLKRDNEQLSFSSRAALGQRDPGAPDLEGLVERHGDEALPDLRERGASRDPAAHRRVVVQRRGYELRRGGRAVDRDVRLVAHEERQRPAVVEVRVGDDRGVQPLDGPKVRGQRSPAVGLYPGVDEDARAPEVQEMAAAADLPGPAQSPEGERRPRLRLGASDNRTVALGWPRLFVRA